jgi:hypothetical protein
MRTARRVIVFLLALSAAGMLWAQQQKPAEGSVDSSVTITGRDDSVIPIPEPGDLEQQVVMPNVDDLLDAALGEAVPSPLVPPVSPPILGPAIPRPTLE